MNRLEKDDQKAIKKWLQDNDILFITHSNELMRCKSLKNQKGLPDLQILHNGKSLFLEVKKADGKYKETLEQLEWKEKLTNAGIKADVAFGYEQAIKKITDFIGINVKLKPP